jgi:hypothetical protein
MSYKDDTLLDRRDAAAKARQALLEKARANDPTRDPDFAARQAARAAANAEREKAATERRAAKDAALAEERRLAAEAKAAAAAAAALEAEKKKPVPKTEAELKAARDARYAARKSRQR